MLCEGLENLSSTFMFPLAAHPVDDNQVRMINKKQPQPGSGVRGVSLSQSPLNNIDGMQFLLLCLGGGRLKGQAHTILW